MSITQYPQLFDWSTIDFDAVRSLLPAYKLPSTYFLSKHYGSVRFLNPPGYPSYFVQHVYTQYGNYPANSAQLVIRANDTARLHVIEHAKSLENCGSRDAWHAQRESVYRRIWKPLPLLHERTLLWMQYVYSYYHNCYLPPSGSMRADDAVIRVPTNREYCTPERSKAVVYIRQFYPEQQPIHEWLETPPQWGSISAWWERYAHNVESAVRI